MKYVETTISENTKKKPLLPILNIICGIFFSYIFFLAFFIQITAKPFDCIVDSVIVLRNATVEYDDSLTHGLWLRQHIGIQLGSIVPDKPLWIPSKGSSFTDSTAHVLYARTMFAGGIDSLLIETEITAQREGNLYLVQFPRPMFRILPSLQQGGGAIRTSAALYADNIGGSNLFLEAEAGYTSELDLGAQLSANLLWQPQPEVQTLFSFTNNGAVKDYRILMQRSPLHTLESGLFAQVQASRTVGNEYSFNYSDITSILVERDMLSVSALWKGNVGLEAFHIITTYQRQYTKQAPLFMQRSGDNQHRIFIGLSAFSPTLQSAGYSSARQQIPSYKEGSFGTFFFGVLHADNDIVPVQYYIGGEAGQQIRLASGTRIAGYISAGTSLQERGKPSLTSQETHLRADIALSGVSTLQLALHQQTVWNWQGLRTLVLDHQSGIRGLPINSRFGDNRIVMNAEYQQNIVQSFLPGLLQYSVFADLGTVWWQEKPFALTEWSVALGAGLAWRPTAQANIGATAFAVDISFLPREKLFAFSFGLKEYFDFSDLLLLQPLRLLGDTPDVQ